MGSGTWSTDTYFTRDATRRASGQDAFSYDADLRSRPSQQWTVADRLDPKWVNANGEKVRESCDSDEHPTSRAIGVFFDVTGSMGGIPRVLQQKLPDLHGLTMRKGYVEHPQILFGAVGDAYTDRVPLQIGQFESDNRRDEDLESLFLEGNGGGQVHETYELPLYYLARHTRIDCFDKRGEKGFLFTMGDEMPYDLVSRSHVADHIGDGLEADISTRDIVAEVRRRYHYFHIVITSGHHGSDPHVQDTWRKLLGEQVLLLDNPELVCETIALAIGLTEGVVDLSTGADHLREAGASSRAITSVSSALARVPKGSAVAKGAGKLPGLSDKGKNKRL